MDRGKLGKRVLRLGAKGQDVLELHKFLREQGYDLGKEDYYGYLTKYAVREFQKEHNLVADGIAGKRFFALVLGENVPVRRRIHVVQPQETLEEICDEYRVKPEAFVGLKHGIDLIPGQKLLFFEREIWGICKAEIETEGREQFLTGLVCLPGASDSLKTTCVIQPDLSLTEDSLKLHHYLRRPKRRRQLANELLDLGEHSRGIYLPWRKVDPLSGSRYLKLLKVLRKKLTPGQMLWAELGAGIPHQKIWGGLNYQEINRMVCRIVLSLPIPEEPAQIIDWVKAEQLLDELGPQINSWKVLIRIPLYGIEWQLTEDKVEYIKLPYGTALARAFRHGARLERDESGALYYRYRSRQSEFHLRLPQINDLTELLNLVNRRNLAGLILDQLGMEDKRVWSIISSHFHLARL